MTIKKAIGKIHLWLGLASGIVVLIVSLTGCLLVFEEEISTLLDYGVYRRVARQDAPIAPPSRVFPVADASLSGVMVEEMYYTVFLNDPRVNVLWARDSSRRYHAVLQNPYTGSVAGSYNYETSFFSIMTFIHTSLALGDTGVILVKYATLVFVIMMITGLILWRPASKKGYRQRFTIKWNASKKRLNYDLHNVMGFYITWIAIFIALTGLVWSFEWFSNSVTWIANGGKNIKMDEVKSYAGKRHYHAGFTTESLYRNIDRAFADSYVTNGEARAITVYKPRNDSDIIKIAVETRNGANYARTDEYSYDQYTAQRVVVKKFADLNNGEKLSHMNYYIHVGKIGGLTGKVLAFFASLVAASLPVTGFMIWRGRRRNQRPQQAES